MQLCYCSATSSSRVQVCEFPTANNVIEWWLVKSFVDWNEDAAAHNIAVQVFNRDAATGLKSGLYGILIFRVQL